MRAERDETADAGPADRETGHGAECGQDQPLGQQLTNQSPVPGAERGPDRELAVSARGTHQQQAGNIGAGNQQKDDDAGLQYVERCARVANQLVAQRDRVPAEPARHREGTTSRQALEVAIHDRLHLRVRLFDGGPRLQPRNHLTELVAPSGVGHLFGCERKRLQNRDLSGRQLEVCRQDTGDAMRLAVQADVAADD